MIKEPSETPLPVGPLLIENGSPVAPGSHDNSDFDLIVYQGMRIQNQTGVIYSVTSKLGSGNFGQVYHVTKQDLGDTEPRDFAMKISKAQRYSLNQFQYETQALSYVCIFIINYFLRVFVAVFFAVAIIFVKIRDFSILIFLDIRIFLTNITG